MEVEVYVYKDRLESMKGIDYEKCLQEAVKFLLNKPYHYVVNVIPYKPFDFSKALPVKVDVNWEFAKAFNKASQEDKAKFYSLIDEDLPLITYFVAKEDMTGGK